MFQLTDPREQPSRSLRRPSVQACRTPTRLISVDNILQHSSDIPSGQPRRRPGPTSAPKQTPSADARSLARLAPQNIPPRTTKVSEKLVLLPETVDDDDAENEEDRADFDVDNDAAPTRDDEALLRESAVPAKGKSYAERLPKSRRAEKLARVTAYGTAEAYNMRTAAAFLKATHGARTKLYDDCLYSVYQRPLMPGLEGYRLRSGRELRIPGGRSLVDEEIERSEQSDHHDSDDEESDRMDEMRRERAMSSPQGSDQVHDRPKMPSPSRPDASTFAELFVFSYGVVVFWNFTERQEKDILADLTFFTTETGRSIVSRPQREEDFETEEFHFEYSAKMRRPRVFNDMITLRSGDHMIKLTISHAIAQSTKLSFFEGRMSHTMEQAQYIPRKLALTGELGMDRQEVVKMLGRLFKSRVDVNLWHYTMELTLEEMMEKASNMLDVPNFFWDSEPTLHPLYIAVREYLEINPRVQVLNERCRVFLDLAEILSDSIADQKMSHIYASS